MLKIKQKRINGPRCEICHSTIPECELDDQIKITEGIMIGGRFVNTNGKVLYLHIHCAKNIAQ